MQKICFFLTDASDKGGIQRVITELSNHFVDGNEVCIVSLFYKDTQGANLLPYEINNKIKFKAFINKEHSKNKFFKKIKTILAISKLYFFMKSERFDIFIANGMESVIWSFLPAYFCKVKYICCDHTSFDRKPLWARMGRKLSRLFAHAIVVLTSSDARGWNNHKVHIIPNPSPYPENIIKTSYNKRRKRVIAIGRLVQVKGFDRLLDIWEKFVKTHPHTPYYLEIIGSGPLKETLNQKIANSLLKNVSVSEFTNDIGSIYNDSQLILMTSYHEGLAMVLIEANSFGVPALAYDVSGPAEVIIDGQTGYLVSDGNEEQFISKLSLLLNNELLREEMSDNCSKYLNRFKIEEVAKKWTRLFEA